MGTSLNRCNKLNLAVPNIKSIVQCFWFYKNYDKYFKYLVCTIFSKKNNVMQCSVSPLQNDTVFRISYSTQRSLILFSNLFIFFTDKANDGTNVAPSLGLRGNLVGAYSPSPLPNQVSRGQPNPFSWRKTKSPQGIPTPFSQGQLG
jgi:hypothetical protein